MISDDDQVIAEQLYKAVNSESWYISFEDAVKTVGEENLVQSFEWFNRQILFGFALLDKYTGTNIGRRKKVTTILDAL